MSRMASCYLALIVAAAVVQLVLGGAVWLIVLLGLIASSSVALFLVDRPRISDVIFLLLALYSGANALVWKTILLQPVQQNLQAPVDTGLYLLAGFVSIALGYLTARFAIPRAPAPFGLARLSTDNSTLSRLAVPLFAAGFLLQLLHIVLRPRFEAGHQLTDGFGGFGSLEFVMVAGLCFGLICWRRGNESAGRTAFPLLCGVALLALGLLGNVKRPVLEGGYAVVLVLAIIPGRRPGWGSTSAGIAAALLFTQVLQPLIHVMRPNLVSHAPTEIASTAQSALADARYDVLRLQRDADALARSNADTYSPASSYGYPAATSLDRFALIFPLDQVVRSLPGRGPMGSDGLRPLVEALPSALVGRKSGVGGGDLIAWRFGIRTPGAVGRPVLGLLASSAAIGGWAGILLLPGAIAFLFLAAADRLGGPLRSSWGIFVCATVSFVIVEQDVSGILAYLLREMVLITVFGWALARWLDRRSARMDRHSPVAYSEAVISPVARREGRPAPSPR